MRLAAALKSVEWTGGWRWHRSAWFAVCTLLALALAAQAAPQLSKKDASRSASSRVPVAPTSTNLLQQPAAAATVTQRNNALTVKANNASLSDILRQVASATGMKLEGLGGDERVFGNFGPAAAGEVLTSLLNGTQYNVLMVGALANGAPRELVLMRKSASSSGGPPAAAQPDAQSQPPNPDEEEQGSDEPDGPQPAPTIEPAVIPQPGVPEPVPPGQPVVPGQPVAPGQQQPIPQPGRQDQFSPRTPQQLLQQIQQQQDQPPSAAPEPPPETQTEPPPE